MQALSDIEIAALRELLRETGDQLLASERERAAAESARAALEAENRLLRQGLEELADGWHDTIHGVEESISAMRACHKPICAEARALLARPAAAAPPHPFTPCCSRRQEAICAWISPEGIRCVADRDEPCHTAAG